MAPLKWAWCLAVCCLATLSASSEVESTEGTVSTTEEEDRALKHKQCEKVVDIAIHTGLFNLIDMSAITEATRCIRSGYWTLDDKVKMTWTTQKAPESSEEGEASDTESADAVVDGPSKMAIELLWDLYTRVAQGYWDETNQACSVVASAGNEPERWVMTESGPPGAEHGVRRFIMALLEAGLRADAEFVDVKRPHAGTLAGTPIGELLFAATLDPEFITAFLAPSTGYYTRGTILKKMRIPRSIREQHGDTKFGLSLLHLIASAGADVQISRTILKIYDAHKRSGITIARATKDHRLDRLMAHSPTLVSMLDFLTDGGSPLQLDEHNASRAFALRVDDEVTESITQSLLRHSAALGDGPGVDFRELVLSLPPVDLDHDTWSEFNGHVNPVSAQYLFYCRAVTYLWCCTVL